MQPDMRSLKTSWECNRGGSATGGAQGAHREQKATLGGEMQPVGKGEPTPSTKRHTWHCQAGGCSGEGAVQTTVYSLPCSPHPTVVGKLGTHKYQRPRQVPRRVISLKHVRPPKL